MFCTRNEEQDGYLLQSNPGKNHIPESASS